MNHLPAAGDMFVTAVKPELRKKVMPAEAFHFYKMIVEKSKLTVYICCSKYVYCVIL